MEILETRALPSIDMYAVNNLEDLSSSGCGPGCVCPACSATPSVVKELPEGYDLGNGHFVGDGHNHQVFMDDQGNLFYVDGDLPVEPAESSSGIVQASDPLGTIQGDDDVSQVNDGSFDLAETFNLHSNPDADLKIYLDFDGHTTSGTFWNQSYSNNNPFTTPAWSLDGSSAFSNNELATIQRIWAAVAEDFAPFEVDVTTEDPGTNGLRKTSSFDTEYGIRVVIGDNTWFPVSAGGVAYLTSFDWSTDTPVFVFNSSEVGVREAASHEVGHALGLSHDGLNGSSYHPGTGSGDTSWGPIMGAPYFASLTQWNPGDYAGANQFEDDLQIITTQNGFGYRTDDYGSTIATAEEIQPTGNEILVHGVIERNTDLDYFSFNHGGGQINIAFDSALYGPNLDILARLYNSSGTLVAISNPTNDIRASFNMTLGAGTYYISVDGTGNTGYSDYGSLGNYWISGSIVPGNGNQNNSPIAQTDNANTSEDNSTSFNVLSNDSDPDGDSLTLTSVSQGSNGSVGFNANGNVTYTPAANFNGNDSFTYTVSDGNGGLSTGTVNVVVSPVNDVPVAMNESTSTVEGNPITLNVLANDTDVDGDNLSIFSFDNGQNGIVTNDGGCNLTFTPDGWVLGSDSFTYSVSDGNGGFATGTVTVTVDPIPEFSNGGFENGFTGWETLGNASTQSTNFGESPTEGNLQALITTNNNAGGNQSDSVMESFLSLNNNSLDNLSTGDATAGSALRRTIFVQAGDTLSFDYKFLTNESTPTSSYNDFGFFTVGSEVILLADTFAAGFSTSSSSYNESTGYLTYNYTFNQNGSFTIGFGVSDVRDTVFDSALLIDNVTLSTSDPNELPVAGDDSAGTNEDQSVTFNVLSNDNDPDGDPLTVTDISGVTDGVVVNNGNGSLTFTPASNFNGDTGFTYTISDGNGGEATASVSISVSPVNDIPVTNNDQIGTNEDQSVVINVLGNDSDVDGDSLAISDTTDPANGVIVVNGNGSITYTPDSNFNGPDTFTYTVDDGNGGVSTATVNVTVNPVNDAPVAVGENVSLDEDTPTTFSNLLDNDSDVDGDTLSILSVTQGQNGSVTLNGNGTVTYTPNNNFFGEDNFTYTIVDGNGGQATATVAITVNPVNDNPVALDDQAETIQGQSVVVNVLGNDNDVDGDSLTITNVSSGNVTITGNGTLTYTPAGNFTGDDVFTYTVDDGNGGQDTGTVTVSVTPVNNLPIAVNDTANTNENQAVVINVVNNDSDPDGDSLTIFDVSEANNGLVTNNEDGTITYTPNNDFFGSDSFAYTIDDGNGGQATATVTVTVNEVNINPVAMSDQATTQEDQAIIIDVLANDGDADGDPLTVIDASEPANGGVSINPNGTITYTPNSGYTGQDAFTYTIDDGNGGQATATVNVTVEAVAGFENGGFEDGLSGWESIGDANTAGNIGEGPLAGSSQGVLTTNNGQGGNQSDSSLENFLGVSNGSLDSINNRNATAGSAIRRTITVEAGATLTFSVNFLTNESVSSFYNDFAFFSVSSNRSSEVYELADTNTDELSSSGSSYSISTGYKTFSYTFTAGGTYTIGFGVIDIWDTVFDSALLIDEISLS